MKLLLTIWISAVLTHEVFSNTLVGRPQQGLNKPTSSVHTEYEATYQQKGRLGNGSYSTVSGKQEVMHDNCSDNWNAFADKCASLIKDLVASLGNAVSSKPGDATNLQLRIRNTFRHFDSTDNCTCLNSTKDALSSLFNNITINTAQPTAINGTAGNHNPSKCENCQSCDVVTMPSLPQQANNSSAEQHAITCEGESCSENNDCQKKELPRHPKLLQQRVSQPSLASTNAENVDPETADTSKESPTNNNRRGAKYPAVMAKDPAKLSRKSAPVSSHPKQPPASMDSKKIPLPYGVTPQPVFVPASRTAIPGPQKENSSKNIPLNFKPPAQSLPPQYSAHTTLPVHRLVKNNNIVRSGIPLKPAPALTSESKISLPKGTGSNQTPTPKPVTQPPTAQTTVTSAESQVTSSDNGEGCDASTTGSDAGSSQTPTPKPVTPKPTAQTTVTSAESQATSSDNGEGCDASTTGSDAGSSQTPTPKPVTPKPTTQQTTVTTAESQTTASDNGDDGDESTTGSDAGSSQTPTPKPVTPKPTAQTTVTSTESQTTASDNGDDGDESTTGSDAGSSQTPTPPPTAQQTTVTTAESQTTASDNGDDGDESTTGSDAGSSQTPTPEPTDQTTVTSTESQTTASDNGDDGDESTTGSDAGSSQTPTPKPVTPKPTAQQTTVTTAESQTTASDNGDDGDESTTGSDAGSSQTPTPEPTDQTTVTSTESQTTASDNGDDGDESTTGSDAGSSQTPTPPPTAQQTTVTTAESQTTASDNGDDGDVSTTGCDAGSSQTPTPKPTAQTTLTSAEPEVTSSDNGEDCDEGSTGNDAGSSQTPTPPPTAQQTTVTSAVSRTTASDNGEDCDGGSAGNDAGSSQTPAPIPVTLPPTAQQTTVTLAEPEVTSGDNGEGCDDEGSIGNDAGSSQTPAPKPDILPPNAEKPGAFDGPQVTAGGNGEECDDEGEGGNGSGSNQSPVPPTTECDKNDAGQSISVIPVAPPSTANQRSQGSSKVAPPSTANQRSQGSSKVATPLTTRKVNNEGKVFIVTPVPVYPQQNDPIKVKAGDQSTGNSKDCDVQSTPGLAGASKPHGSSTAPVGNNGNQPMITPIYTIPIKLNPRKSRPESQSLQSGGSAPSNKGVMIDPQVGDHQPEIFYTTPMPVLPAEPKSVANKRNGTTVKSGERSGPGKPVVQQHPLVSKLNNIKSAANQPQQPVRTDGQLSKPSDVDCSSSPTGVSSVSSGGSQSPVTPPQFLKPLVEVTDDSDLTKATTFQTTSTDSTPPQHSIQSPPLKNSVPATRPGSLPQDSDETVHSVPATTPHTIHSKGEDDDEDEDCCSCESCTEEDIANPKQYKEMACKDLEEARKELKAIFDKIKKKLKCGRKAPQKSLPVNKRIE